MEHKILYKYENINFKQLINTKNIIVVHIEDATLMIEPKSKIVFEIEHDLQTNDKEYNVLTFKEFKKKNIVKPKKIIYKNLKILDI